MASTARNEHTAARYMPRSLQREPDGVAVALVIHLSLYCAVAAFFALVVYYLMQPTWRPNPGMTAHKPSPITLNYVEVLRSEREAAHRAAKFEPEPETTSAATREAPDVKPEAKKPKNTSQSRTHPVRRQQQPRPVRRQQQPPDTTHYAQRGPGSLWARAKRQRQSPRRLQHSGLRWRNRRIVQSKRRMTGCFSSEPARIRASGPCERG